MNRTAQPITFVDGLALLFIAFKLAGIIGWSWAWVLAPIWIALTLVVVFALIAAGRR